MRTDQARTGKTFRKLTECLLKVSAGIEVVLVVPTRAAASDLFCKAVGMLESYHNLSSLSITSRSNLVKIHGCKGSLTIVDVENSRPYKEHRGMNDKFQIVRDCDEKNI